MHYSRFFFVLLSLMLLGRFFNSAQAVPIMGKKNNTHNVQASIFVKQQKSDSILCADKTSAQEDGEYNGAQNSGTEIKNKDRSIHHITKLPQSADADWLIIGAGPAGIATIGVLLDIGVPQERITWLDPEFCVGRIGAHYGAVTANNMTGEFIAFVNACKVFQQCDAPAVQELRNCDPSKFDNLEVIIEPLICITQHLRAKIHSLKDTMVGLHFDDNVWHVSMHNNDVITATHVVLATGSRPKTLPYEQHKIIPLDVALNPNNLQAIVQKDDVVGVVGGSHSAILLLKFLSEMSVKHIYNFYMHDLIYAVDMGSWIMNEISGLKGMTAQWAQEVLEKNPPKNVTRVKIEDGTLATLLPDCSKVIYAIGYERNELPLIHDSHTDVQKPITTYNKENGFIAPRLFGIGIAFPEEYIDDEGRAAHCVGLGCFMEYAQSMVPQWEDDTLFKYIRWQVARVQCAKFKKMENLFKICVL